MWKMNYSLDFNFKKISHCALKHAAREWLMYANVCLMQFIVELSVCLIFEMVQATNRILAINTP